MKTAVWYTSTFLVIFIYLYCYLVQFIRGAEIRPQLHLHQPLLRNRLGGAQPSSHMTSFPPVIVGAPSHHLGWPSAGSGAGNQHPSLQRHLPPLPPPPPASVFSDYLTPGNMAVSSSISVSSSVSSAPVHPSVTAAPLTPAAPKPLDFGYHNYDNMTAWLKHFSASNPDLTALYSIGKSVQGRELWVMVVSSSPFQHMKGKPDVKYVANIHGNEAVSREMALHLIEHLVKNYREDAYIRWLLDQTRIHILPSLNPDGFEVAREGTCTGGQGRYNARGFDLNRNFPDYFKQNTKRVQPETEAYKEWIAKIQFTLSAGLHAGALVASYPFDNTPNSVYQAFASTPSQTPDDDVFHHLATLYARNHATMYQGVACKPGSPSFPNGTTNGAAWYPLTGGAQDYSYVWTGTMEITVEMACCKYPPAAELPVHWSEHRQALIRFVGEAHRGVRGFVTDGNGRPLENVAMKIKGRDAPFQTTKHGEYWRILLPGYYRIEAYKEGYEPVEDDFSVTDHHATQVNLTLFKQVDSKNGFGTLDDVSNYYSLSASDEQPNKRHPSISNKQDVPHPTGLSGLLITLRSQMDNLFANLFG